MQNTPVNRQIQQAPVTRESDRGLGRQKASPIKKEDDKRDEKEN
jgi:hypothetical protein